jgi:hypothetical protein
MEAIARIATPVLCELPSADRVSSPERVSSCAVYYDGEATKATGVLMSGTI